MIIKETGIAGLKILEPKVHGDERGYFFECYNKEVLKSADINIEFIQDNEALSSKSIFRGFHYQIPPFAQTKLVRVIKGSVLDMVIDIRPTSKTYGKTYQIILSEKNKLQFLVPQGFAHGYISLEDNTIFSYKVDQYYNRASENGISHLDDKLDFEWPIDPTLLITSDKDKMNPKFGEHVEFK